MTKPQLAKLGRDSAHRWAMLRTMVTQLINHERIETTITRAKELRRVADNMVTLAKKGTNHHRIQANAVVRDKHLVAKLWDVFAPRYADRAGGYTRVMRSRVRRGDNATMAFIEFVNRPGEIRPARPGRANTDITSVSADSSTVSEDTPSTPQQQQ